MSRRRWPQVRAGLIAAAILLALVDGCPLPEAGYERPHNRAVAEALRPVQRVILRPFGWLKHAVRFTQRWALFQTAASDRYRVEVLARRAPDAAWELLYRAGDPDHTAYGGLLQDERVRGAWNPTDKPMVNHQAFARWFGKRVLAEHPEYAAVRMWLERVVIDHGERRGTGTYILAVDTTRATP